MCSACIQLSRSSSDTAANLNGLSSPSHTETNQTRCNHSDKLTCYSKVSIPYSREHTHRHCQCNHSEKLTCCSEMSIPYSKEHTHRQCQWNHSEKLTCYSKMSKLYSGEHTHRHCQCNHSEKLTCYSKMSIPYSREHTHRYCHRHEYTHVLSNKTFYSPLLIVFLYIFL